MKILFAAMLPCGQAATKWKLRNSQPDRNISMKNTQLLTFKKSTFGAFKLQIIVISIVFQCFNNCFSKYYISHDCKNNFFYVLSYLFFTFNKIKSTCAVLKTGLNQTCLPWNVDLVARQKKKQSRPIVWGHKLILKEKRKLKLNWKYTIIWPKTCMKIIIVQ